MESLEKMNDEQLLDDLKKLLKETNKALDEKDYKKAMQVKESIHERWKYLDKVKFSNTGSQTFRNYRSVLQEASAKSGGRWYENAKNPYDRYTHKLDEIRFELEYNISMEENRLT
ncbi:hypothetical protein [Staphylococcus kloosii]|uniref:hypothetical protein n=1 Tax=Staphylococcus kloosii TaxID=29384 RepID=UPI0018A07615|nr:hypothetical protein [Staphylococcus kloosii]MBF7029643.1 hypothetical protein [Staphylococcus kloosii]